MAEFGFMVLLIGAGVGLFLAGVGYAIGQDKK